MNTSSEIWSTPVDAPLIPPFPFSYRSAEILTVSYKTEPDAISRILPAPLQPRSSWVLIHLYNMRDVDYLGSYGECNVMVEGELQGKIRGGFSPFLFLSSDAGLAQGREVHGQPKKYGNARVEFRGDLLVGLLERNGIDVITATMAYKQRRGDLQPRRRSGGRGARAQCIAALSRCRVHRHAAQGSSNRSLSWT